MPTIKDMCEQRTKLITDAQALVLGEKVTVEQRAQANKMVADVEILEADINTAQRLEKFELESRSSVKPPRGAPAAGSDESAEKSAKEVRAFEHYIRTGEKRDLTTTSMGAVIPQLFNSQIVDAQKLVGNLVSVVGKKVTDMSGAPLKVGMTNDTGNTLTTMTGETTVVGEADPAVSGFIMQVDTVATSVKVSYQELEDNSFDVASWIKTKFGIRYFRGLEYLLANGNASNVASVVSTATLGATSEAAGLIGYDDFVAIYSALDPAYEGNANWAMNSTTRARVMGLKDTLGRPLFIPNPNSGVLDHILGRPIVLSQPLPTAFTSGNVGVLYGDFNEGYLLRTDGPMSIRRSDDRFVDSLETIFVAYARVGGHSTDAGTHPILALHTL